MVGLALNQNIMEQLGKVAHERGTTTQVLAEEAVRQFLRAEARRKMRRELDAFRAMHSRLLAEYPAQYVAIYEGRVVDHDADQLALFLRVDRQYPDTDVLIQQVLPEVEESYTFHSPQIIEEQWLGCKIR